MQKGIYMIKIFDFYKLNTELANVHHSIDKFKYSFYLNWLGNPILQILEFNNKSSKKNCICYFVFREEAIILSNKDIASDIDFKELVEHFNDITSIYLRYGRDVGSVCKILLDNDLINKIYNDLSKSQQDVKYD